MKGRKNSPNTIILISVIVCIFLGLGVCLIYRSVTKFHYEKVLDQEAISTADGAIRLRDLSYYFMMEEESVNEIALTYDENNPKAYWGLYINNTFVNKEAKETAIDYCLRDTLYAHKATEEGFCLSKEEQGEIHTKATMMLEDMTEKQKSLCMTEEDLVLALSNQKLANNYVIHLAKKEGIELTEEVLSAYYGLNSKYFKAEKEGKSVKINQKLLDHISLGSLTIN